MKQKNEQKNGEGFLTTAVFAKAPARFQVYLFCKVQQSGQKPLI